MILKLHARNQWYSTEHNLEKLNLEMFFLSKSLKICAVHCFGLRRVVFKLIEIIVYDYYFDVYWKNKQKSIL